MDNMKEEVEDKKEDEADGIGLGRLITVGLVVVIIVVAMGIHATMTAPYHMADDLRERIDAKGNVSDDYRQGWLDCVDYFLKLSTEPTNMTGGMK